MTATANYGGCAWCGNAFTADDRLGVTRFIVSVIGRAYWECLTCHNYVRPSGREQQEGGGTGQ